METSWLRVLPAERGSQKDEAQDEASGSYNAATSISLRLNFGPGCPTKQPDDVLHGRPGIRIASGAKSNHFAEVRSNSESLRARGEGLARSRYGACSQVIKSRA